MTVKEAEAVLKSIKITGADSGKKGTTVQLSITPDPANADASVTWKSSDDKIAKVDANGKVTCVNTGKVTITPQPPRKIQAKQQHFPSRLQLMKNEFDVREVKVTAGETKTIISPLKEMWKVVPLHRQHLKHATVDGNGKIRAIRSGETEITVTAKYKNGDTRSKR